MKRKLKRLICSVVLVAMLLSSVASAAPASVAGCGDDHNWGVAKFVEEYDYIVRDQKCSVCGTVIHIYRTYKEYTHTCLHCHIQENFGGLTGPEYSKHSGCQPILRVVAPNK